MTKPLNSSLATFSINGQSFPLVREKSCKVCSSPDEVRLMVEEQTVAGRVWSKIAESLPPDIELSPRNIRDHYSNGHLPVVEASVREYMHEQAEARGEVLAPAVKAQVAHLSLAEAVVANVLERLSAGILEPTVRDGLSAGDHLARTLEAAGHFTEADAVEAFIAYFDTLRKFVDEDTFAAYGRALNQHPTLARLREGYHAGLAAGETR